MSPRRALSSPGPPPCLPRHPHGVSRAQVVASEFEMEHVLLWPFNQAHTRAHTPTCTLSSPSILPTIPSHFLLPVIQSLFLLPISLLSSSPPTCFSFSFPSSRLFLVQVSYIPRPSPTEHILPIRALYVSAACICPIFSCDSRSRVSCAPPGAAMSATDSCASCRSRVAVSCALLVSPAHPVVLRLASLLVASMHNFAHASPTRRPRVAHQPPPVSL